MSSEAADRVRDARHALLICDEPGCTHKRGDAIKVTDGPNGRGFEAPCPRCRGAGRLPDPAFDVALNALAADLAAARAREQRAALVFTTLREWTLEHLDSLPAEDEDWDLDHVQPVLESLRCIITGNLGCTEESDYAPEQWAVLMAARAALADQPAADEARA